MPRRFITAVIILCAAVATTAAASRPSSPPRADVGTATPTVPDRLIDTATVTNPNRSSTAVTNEDRTTFSHYVHWGRDADRRARAEDLGCRHARQPGMFLLAFGRQRDDGAQAFSPAGIYLDRDHIAGIVADIIAGIGRCNPHDQDRWTVVIATSNYRLDSIDDARRFAPRWRDVVTAVRQRSTDSRIRIVGGSDIEPGWGRADAARAWVEAYTRTGEPLVVNASADGCPAQGPAELQRRCANGWTVADVVEVTWGSPHSTALPQIYRRDGVQAGQWALLADAAHHHGLPPRFAGVMTQHQACIDVGAHRCPHLDNTPRQGLTQMRQHLSSRGLSSTVDTVTDVGWHHR